MEEERSKNGLQFSPLATIWTANTASDLLGNMDPNLHYVVTPPSNGIQLEPLPGPQWIHCQPTPQNYVEFLAERGYPQIQKQISHDISTQVPTLGPANPSQLEYLRPHKGGDIITTVTGLEYQFGVQKQIWNEECGHAFETYSVSGSSASKYPSEVWRPRKRSKEKAYAADRCRRLRISHWLDALQELVPHSKMVDKAALLDNVIGLIQYLQNQMKDLSQSRLVGESTSDSVIFLEGHGHYVVREQKLNGPLEEMMGKLIDVYPSTATELLQSRGLMVMPMTSTEGLLEEILDV